MIITAATSIHYGNYKYLLQTVKELYQILLPNLEHFDKILNLPKNIDIHFKPIRNYQIIGQYDSIKNRIEIDPRKDSTEDILITICHELVHAEQHYENRLTCDSKYFYWKGQQWKATLDDNIYKNFPWEIEAYDRQFPIFEQTLQQTFLKLNN